MSSLRDFEIEFFHCSDFTVPSITRIHDSDKKSVNSSVSYCVSAFKNPFTFFSNSSVVMSSSSSVSITLLQIQLFLFAGKNQAIFVTVKFYSTERV
uniref:Uncharacterized protein n=1 Tax=Noccaea caerulescens TaxID=107243 RepID=A0A1J3K770_NOCCA